MFNKYIKFSAHDAFLE